MYVSVYIRVGVYVRWIDVVVVVGCHFPFSRIVISSLQPPVTMGISDLDLLRWILVRPIAARIRRPTLARLHPPTAAIHT